MGNLNKDEQEILEYYERGEWKTVNNIDEEKKRIIAYFKENQGEKSRENRGAVTEEKCAENEKDNTPNS